MAVDSKAAWHKKICLHTQKYIFTFHSKFILTIKAFLSIQIHNSSHLYFVKQAAAHRKPKRWNFIYFPKLFGNPTKYLQGSTKN